MGIRHKNGIIVIYKGCMPNIAQMDLVQWDEIMEKINDAHSPNVGIIGAGKDS